MLREGQRPLEILDGVVQRVELHARFAERHVDGDILRVESDRLLERLARLTIPPLGMIDEALPFVRLTSDLRRPAAGRRGDQMAQRRVPAPERTMEGGDPQMRLPARIAVGDGLERGCRLGQPAGALERLGPHGQGWQVRAKLRRRAERLDRRGELAQLEVPLSKRDQDPMAILGRARRRDELAELAGGFAVVAERIESIGESLAVLGAAAGLRGRSKPSG